jgi:hypothetical protein
LKFVKTTDLGSPVKALYIYTISHQQLFPKSLPPVEKGAIHPPNNLIGDTIADRTHSSSSLFKRCFIVAGRRWLTTVILATQEAEIRRIAVQSQPGQIVCETLS